MKKYLLIFFTILFFPFIASAKEYKDVVAPIVGLNTSDNITIYFFHGDGCPHCADETIFLQQLKAEYKDKINIIKYETWYNESNEQLMNKVKEYFNSSARGVPFTVVGEEYFSGYNSYIGEDIKSAIDDYFNPKSSDKNEENNTETKNNEEIENNKETTIPILGKINMKKVSIPIVAIILGILDGFNPCAMWILLFLINMLFTMKDRKKMWVLGFTFLFTSAFVYFLAMLGLNVVLSFTTINWVRSLIGIVALIGGIINIRSYIKTKEDGCHIVDDKKRNKYFNKITHYLC